MAQPHGNSTILTTLCNFREKKVNISCNLNVEQGNGLKTYDFSNI